MKNTVHSLILAASALALLSACVQDQSPGTLNRNKVLLLRGDGWAIQRFSTTCERPVDGERRHWKKKHHRRHNTVKAEGAAPVSEKMEAKPAPKAEPKKEEPRKDSGKKDGKGW